MLITLTLNDRVLLQLRILERSHDVEYASQGNEVPEIAESPQITMGFSAPEVRLLDTDADA